MDVLTGFGVVLVVMALGFVVAKTRALGPGAQRVLAAVVYSIATPALLFDKLTHTDPAKVFSAHLVVAAGSALLVGLACGLVARLGFGFRRDEAIIAALASSYANAGNLGVPLAAYILGDAAAVVPVMLFQIAFYAPVTLTAIDLLHQREGGGPGPASEAENTAAVGQARKPTRGRGAGREAWWRNLATAAKNPMLLGALIGIVFSAGHIPVPALLAQPVSMLAGACVPLALLVFGMSLAESRPRLSLPVCAAAGAKTIVQPLLAGLAAYYLFGMGHEDLMSAVLIGALPTAQNVYAYALRFRVGEEFARDTGVVSTAASIPVIIAAAAFLG